MGLLTDFIIAPETDAEKICEAQGGHAQSWPSVSLKRVDNIKLAALWKLVSPACEAESLEGDAFLIYSPESEGPWVFRLPDEFVQQLASITSERLKEFATAWSGTEEAVLDRWTHEDCVSVIRELSVLSRRALSEGKPVLLWMCL